MSKDCSWMNLRTSAWVVGIIDFLVGPIGFLVTNRLSSNPHLGEEMNFTNIHPEFEQNMTESVIMSAVQGIVLNEWVATMIYYPPIFLTFLVGLQLLIAVHQRNYCVGKLALILNYILLGLILILSIVLMANDVHVVAVSPFLFFSILQSICLFIVFKYVMYELKNPGVTDGCYRSGSSRILPDRFHDEDDLNL